VAESAAYRARMGANQASLDAADWAALERTLLTWYSWGMPPDLREAFRARHRLLLNTRTSPSALICIAQDEDTVIRD
jgi:hypothetical protein